jgi:DnaJ-class molecular chaperone
MNKSSGFRTIEFKEKECNYRDVGFSETEYCNSGIIYRHRYTSIPYSTDRLCKKCNGTGTVEKAECKIE